jgi:predicted neuraminidase
MEEDRDYDSAHASTLVELSEGNVLASWFGGSWEKGADVAIWVSKRVKGKWCRPRKIQDERSIAMWNPVLFKKSDGTIILFYKVGETIQQWKTYFVTSSDEGETFSAARELVEGDIGGRGPVKNKPIYLMDGTIVAPASLEGGTWDAFVDLSKDAGQTWQKSELVPIRRVGYDIQMVDRPYDKHYCYGKGVIQPTLWESEAGKVHMFLRSTSSRIFRSDSEDGGKTWSLAYSTGLPNNNSGIDLVKLPNGILVLAYNPTENLPNYYKGSRTPLILSYSEDNGQTWKELAVLEDTPGGYAYPAIICNDKSELLITYTWKRERIVFCKLTYEL